jgi:HK97 family phage portal protein
MKLPWFGTKGIVAPISVSGSGGSLVPASSSSTFLGFIRESFAGAWQRNVVIDNDRNLLAFSAVYACITLIANDIGKLRLKLMERSDGVWEETTESPAFNPVLRKPNHYQNRIQFLTCWMMSKLMHGNTYVLKRRDGRNVVAEMYVLDPRLVVPQIALDGSVFYQLNVDRISELEQAVIVPASEVIHDRMPALWHPLIGVSPIYACGSSATQGIRIQANSAAFFENMSRPSGVLTAPGVIQDETAERLKKAFEENFAGSKLGRLAVLGDGLKYEPMTIPASDAQLIEQLKWTVEDVARCFHVPLHMIGSANPTFQNIGSLTQSYYTQTLQSHIESLELALDEGLSLPDEYGVELDLDGLLRMDTSSRFDAWGKAIGAGWMSPNEARLRENLEPVAGGQTPYLQQQNWSLAQLDKRTMPPDPAAAGGGTPASPAVVPTTTPEPTTGEDDDEVSSNALAVALIFKFAEAAYAEN